MSYFLDPRLFARKSRQLPRRRVRYPRPILEQLEDRTLPTSFGFAFGLGSPYEKAIAVDKAGDVFVPTPSVLYKFSPSASTGQPLWAVNYGALNIPGPNGNGGGSGSGGVGGGLGTAIAVDAAGNVYVVGSGSPYWAAVEKFDGTSGQLLWVRDLGTSNPEDPYGSISCSGTGLALDSAGNVYLTGSFTTGDTFTHALTLTFWSGADFQAQADPNDYLDPNDTGADEADDIPPASKQPLNLYQPYAWGPGAFVAELDSNGQLVWDGGLLNTGPGPSYQNYYVHANGISTDAAGNVYIAGGFAGTANFDPNGGSYALTSSNASLNATSYPFPPDAFALKLNSAHQLVWVDDMRAISNAQGSGSAGNAEARGIASDAAGNVYLTGGFGGNVYFDPASGSHEHSQESSYAFVEKLDTNGSFQWFSEVTGSPAVGQAIALDPAGNVYSTGFFNNNVYLPTYFGSTLVQFEGQWNTNAYVWQLDANGNTTWAGQLGGPNTFVAGYAIGIDSAGDIFAAGQMEADPNNVPEFTAVPVYFDPGPATSVLQTNTFGQSFLLKLIQNTPPTADAGGPYTIYEGNSLTLDVSASTDPDGDPLTYSWNINGVFAAATGVSPTLTWSQLNALGIYDDQAPFSVSVQVDDQHGNVVVSPATTLTVTDAPLTAGTSQTLMTTEGMSLNGAVASFTDANPVSPLSDFSATINWGDGSAPDSSATISQPGGPGTPFSVNGIHSYGEEGNFPVTVNISDIGGSTASADSTVNVADAPLTATATPVTTAVYATPFSGEVATFNDANPYATLSDFPLANVTIQWGDGTTSNATSITQPGGVGTAFDVFGNHTYGQAGATASPLLVTITDVGGAVSNSTSYTPTVGKVHLTVTADNQSKPYDGAVFSAFTATISGFVNNETVSVVSGSPAFSGTATTATSAGTYTITPAVGSLSATNYDFTTFVNGTLTILSAQQQMALITAQINALVPGVLNSGNGNALTTKLSAATASLNSGNIAAGINQLNAFINQVNAFLKTGKLTAAQAQPLIAAANQAIASAGTSGAHLMADAGANTVSAGDTQPVTDAGQLVTGTVGVCLDKADGTPVAADEQARFDDAISALDAAFGPYGVNLVDVGALDAADALVQVEMAATSGAGSAADGVLGCTVAGQITLVTGWDWYTGADPSAIGAGQYDFETIVMHELGHSVGLGHSGDTGSVMYPTLATDTARRAVTTADLSVLEQPSTTAEPLLAVPRFPHAADLAASAGTVNPAPVAPLNNLGRDMLFAAMTGDRWGTPAEAGASAISGIHPTALAAGVPEWNSGSDISTPSCHASQSIFAGSSAKEDGDLLLEMPMFADSDQGVQGDGAQGMTFNKCFLPIQRIIERQDVTIL